MAGRIPKSFIADLVARTDIVELVTGYMTLKKRGTDHWAPCPFHNEKTPSFKVSAERQTYHCFGCGAHGTSVGFLMEYSGFTYPEAIEHLADMHGLEVPREQGSAAREDLSPLYDALTRVNGWYQQQLRNHPSRNKAVEYLKGRGLSGKIAAQFELGLAPPGRDHLLALPETGEDWCNTLTKAGLLVERAPGQFADRFWHRIMFPIHDRRGRVIGFGARTLDGANPKYLNSPETPVFVKGRELYGLYQARRSHRKLARLVVVEGYTDVVALAQFDITYAVATLGTAVTADHVERLFQATTRVVFCFDGDAAGRQAAWRALQNALPHMRDGRSIGFVFLPEGEDPDSLVRAQGKEALETLVSQAQPLSDVLFQQLTEAIDLTTIEGRAQFHRDAQPLVEKIPFGAFRELVYARMLELAKLNDEQSERTRPVKNPAPRRIAYHYRENSARLPPLSRTAIKLLLHHPSLAADVRQDGELKALNMPGVNLLLEMLELLTARPDLNTAAVIEHFRDHQEGQHLARLVDHREPLLRDGLADELQGALDRLVCAYREERRRSLARKMAESKLDDDEVNEYRTLVSGGSPIH
ncbi:MAG: DNA primase [Gammaproteobacteria bacterium]|nr:DNA primase [Gammaproteobacteria bacterium]